MRRLLSFTCEGSRLGGSLDEASGEVGVVIVTGGSQTRIGSHRMFERLARDLAAAGHPCFRFDRRGVGDSEGEDPGFKGSGPDIAAAAAAFRAHCPHVERIAGFGLCDGATALALFGAAAGIERIVLANPWFVEAEAGAPPPAAIKHHYRQQLMSAEGWKRLLGGSVSYTKIARGLLKIARPGPTNLAAEIAAALGANPQPVRMLLATGDATAIAADGVWCSKPFTQVRKRSPAPARIDSDSHTFARAGDPEALTAALLSALSD